jgi:SMC interacting uncharacterized protein involved in chromosome segregation
MSSVLTEINRRLEEKNKLLDEKTQQLNKLTEEVNKFEVLKKEIETKATEIDTIKEKETQLLKDLPKKELIIQLDDGSFEVVNKEDVEVVSDDVKKVD